MTNVPCFITIDDRLVDRNLIARIDPVESHGACWGFRIYFSVDSVPPLVVYGDNVEFGKPENKTRLEKARDVLVSSLKR